MVDLQGAAWQAGGMPTAVVPPLLRIDWGCDLRIGSNLRPEFQLLCPGLRSRPHVTIHVDHRLDHDDWKDVPNLTQEAESHWSFDEPLRMTSGGRGCSPGMYGIELRAVFPEPGMPARCFRANLRIKVNDPSQQSGPTLEIDAGDGSLVNLAGSDLSRYGVVRLKGSGQSVLNVQEAMFPMGGSAGSEAMAKPDSLNADILLKSDYELEHRIPRLCTWGRREFSDRAALVFPRGQRILLLAQPLVKLGRERVDKYGQRTSDIVLRLWPRETDAHKELSRLISRVHVRLSLAADGLHIEDQSSCGTYVQGERVVQTLRVRETASRSLAVAVAGILGIEVVCHRDPTWTPWAEWIDLVEQQYQRVVDSTSPLWPDARSAGIDAVRLRRARRLPVREHLGHLSQCLDAASYQVVHRAAHSIDPIDELADREEYVLVFRTATLGGSQENDAICLPDSGLAAAHARILHLGGCFWLEHLREDQRICVDGQTLARHELAPLAPGMRLSLGRTEVVFADFNQPEL